MKDFFASFEERFFSLPDNFYRKMAYQSLCRQDLSRMVLPWEVFDIEEGKRSKVTKEEIKSLILPECQNSYLVFVDGVFDEKISSLIEGCEIFPIEEAFSLYGTFLQNQYVERCKAIQDPFYFLSLAMQENSFFLHVTSQTSIAPIQILHVFTSEGFYLPYLPILLEKKSKTSFFMTCAFLEKNKKHWVSQSIDLFLEEGAVCEYLSMGKEESFCFESLMANVKKEAFLDLQTIVLGGRNSYRVFLEEEKAKVSMKGFCALEKKQETHIEARVDHLRPYTYSEQEFRGILEGASRSYFLGNILMTPHAIKSEGKQLSRHLILSDEAKAFTSPSLDIFSEDVKVFHGATIAQLNEEEMFYLAARGIEPKVAKTLLIQGFCKEIIEEIKSFSLKQEIEKILMRGTKHVIGG